MADNVLWGGKVIAPSKDKETSGIIEFNEFVKNDDRVDKMIIPFRDGLMLIRKMQGIRKLDTVHCSALQDSPVHWFNVQQFTPINVHG